MPTKTPTKPTTNDAVEQARAGFERAVLTSGVAVDEYRTWVDAWQVAQVERTDQSSAAARVGAEQRATYTRLRQEAKILPSLEQRINGDVNSGANFGGSATYTAEAHRRRVAAWLSEASEYAGREFHTIAPLELPLPREPFVPPLAHTAPLPYSAAVDQVLNTASKETNR